MVEVNYGIIQHGGTLRGKQVIVGDNANASLTENSVPSEGAQSSGDDRLELLELFDRLRQQLQALPEAQSKKGGLLASQAEHLVRVAVKEKSDPKLLSKIGNSLKGTASFLKDTIPAAVEITEQILAIASRLHGVGI